MSKVIWRRHNLVWLWLSFAVFVIDQLSKLFMRHWLDLFQAKSVFPYFSFLLLHNKGAAFSFLDGYGSWASWCLGIITVTICVALINWMLRTSSRRRLLLVGLALIIGGALGNLWDRFTLGYVIDFLLFHYKDWYFPAFNFADSAITMGAFLLIIDMVFFNNER